MLECWYWLVLFTSLMIAKIVTLLILFCCSYMYGSFKVVLNTSHCKLFQSQQIFSFCISQFNLMVSPFLWSSLRDFDPVRIHWEHLYNFQFVFCQSNSFYIRKLFDMWKEEFVCTLKRTTLILKSQTFICNFKVNSDWIVIWIALNWLACKYCNRKICYGSWITWNHQQLTYKE